MSEGNNMKPPGGTTTAEIDPREILRGRMAEPQPVKIPMTREGDVLLGRFLRVVETQTRYTKPGKKDYAVQLTEADASGVFNAPEVPAGELAQTLLLGYAPRDLAKLRPQVGEWIAIRRGAKVQGAENTYNKWEVHSARPEGNGVNLAELADDQDDENWSTGAFEDSPPF